MAVGKVVCVRSEGAPPKQGGASSRDSSPNEVPSPKAVVGSFALDGVPRLWDDSPAIRDRIRDGAGLLMRYDPTSRKPEKADYVEATIENLKLNAAVLKPVLQVMQEHRLQLPSVEALNASIETFYMLCKMTKSGDQIYQECWGIRRMIGKAKKIIYRACPPQDGVCEKQTGWTQFSCGFTVNYQYLTCLKYRAMHDL